MSGAASVSGGSTPPPVGEWVLKSARFEFQDNGEAFDIYGSEPTGRLTLTEAGRFTAFITAPDRKPYEGSAEAGFFKGMIAYAGPCAVEGDKLVIKVDLAWHPAWVGTEQVRFFEVVGDTLRLRSAPLGNPAHADRVGVGVFTCERAG